MRINEIVQNPKLPSNTVYLEAMDFLYDQYPEIKIGGGIGLCAFASGKLQEKLSDTVKLELIIGRRLTDDTLFDVATQNWKEIPADDIRANVAEYFLTHNKQKKDIGHCVCYDGEQIIDITSSQFGIPQFYSLDDFTSMFEKIKRNCKVKIDSIEDFGVL